MLFKLNFDQYVPVQHQRTEAYFAFLVTENQDFDAAGDTEMYRCYPVFEDGRINTQLSYNYPKNELQTILLVL
ncbi:hypothetical protein AHMF7605_29215 [Adhaeribacter arboris]|uniref:Uncharacterized protein n=1 Tax=Adhaeribacter arboris TaxID=2072846 RepID=A0A2T2Y8J8_9BACT|nr:hypothetical protein [Adhaeribacter arboris]PSR51851.1 hypothetical protein AHMF7605_28470 [Adhaeribacter arboris]PSR51987.1 hypothetical protein AHMF7605_29215 [Adhaeribacter arboris]